VVHYPAIDEITKPNAEDFDGDYWDPWEALGVRCASYNSEIDLNAIAVLRGIADGLYNSDIAERTGLTPAHVELFQALFCGADWCEYGTSPRGCFPLYRDDFPRLIEAWENYYRRHWDEEPTA
jgi:hypothetical protein